MLMMVDMSRRFNFDDFDELCRDALDERMNREGQELEERQKWGEHDRRPGEVGGVLVQLSSIADRPSSRPLAFDPEFDPPEAA
jgi:Uma2 family endonuclease